MKAETTKKEKTTIEVAEHTAFEGDMKTNLVSSIEMAEVVSSLFGAAFADYYGCKICINNSSNPAVVEAIPLGSIYVELYFKDRGNNNRGIKNLRLRGQVDTQSSNNMAARVRAVSQNINPMTSSHVYEVTNETYEALEEFMNVSNIRWSAYTQEISANMGIIGTKEEAVVCITGLSLDKILTKIYGSETEEGRFEYTAIPATMIPARSNEFIMQVSQLNLEVVRKLQRELGFNVPSSSQFHVYR